MRHSVPSSSLVERRASSQRRMAAVVVGVVLVAVVCLRPQQPGESVPVGPAPTDVTPEAPPVKGAQPRTTVSGAETVIAPSEGGCRRLRLHSNVTGRLASVELCGSGCEGLEARIKLKTPWARDPPSLSQNADVSKYLARRFGPHFFRLRFEGPTAFVVTPTKYGDSEYRGLVPTLAQGTYTLAWEWLYSDYAAVNERDARWPPLLKQSLLELDTTFSTRYHRQQCTLPSVERVTCAADSRAASVPSALCAGDEADTGVWVRGGTPSSSSTRVRVRKIRREPILFEWAIQPDYDWRWRPNACRVGASDVPTVLSQLAGKKLLIGGDSQLRALYFGLVNVLSGNELPCVRNVTTLDQEPAKCVANVKGSQHKLIQGVQVDFVDDVFLDRFAAGDRYAQYDVIVVGFAQHPASKEHWTLSKFSGSAAARAKRASAFKAQGKSVVWYGAPQYPYTTQGYPVIVKDWRTDARLTLFNEAAFRAMRAEGIPVVDAFNITTGMSHTSPDQAHYSNFVSAELVHVVLTVICQTAKLNCGD